jgi:hypothetical protein
MTVRLRVVGQRQTEGGRRGRQDGGRHPGCCWCPSFKLKLNQGRKAEAKVLEPSRVLARQEVRRLIPLAFVAPLQSSMAVADTSEINILGSRC